MICTPFHALFSHFTGYTKGMKAVAVAIACRRLLNCICYVSICSGNADLLPTACCLLPSTVAPANSCLLQEPPLASCFLLLPALGSPCLLCRHPAFCPLLLPPAFPCCSLLPPTALSLHPLASSASPSWFYKHIYVTSCSFAWNCVRVTNATALAPLILMDAQV